VKDEELALAVQLIEQAASDAFEPEKYEDEVSKKVLALIEKKIEGEEITAVPEVEADDKIVDLMEALKASLGTGDGPAESKDRKPAKRASSRGKGKDKKRAAR
jgi:DNA end-binding protein Ku